LITNWLRFADPAFAFEFDYPRITPGGSAVILQRHTHELDERIHLTSEDLDVYFELDRAADRSAMEGVRALAEDLRGRFEDVWFGVPESTELCGVPARSVRFRFGRRVRWAVFTEEAAPSYRVILDPRSATNLAILGTFTLRRGDPSAG
jgi:hypothetical protein